VFIALPQLNTLDLAGTKITNELIPTLSACFNLVKLNMGHTQVDDDGLVCMNAPRLSTLTIDGTEITMWSVNRILFSKSSCCTVTRPLSVTLKRPGKSVLLMPSEIAKKKQSEGVRFR